MTSPAEGESLGDAVHALLRAPAAPARSVKQQLRYLTAKTTGASEPSVARQLGVPLGRLRIWLSGKASPNAANRGKIERLFEQFWGINNRFDPGNRMLRVKGPGVYVHDVPRTSILVEKGKKPRDWNVLRKATAADISAEFGSLFIKALDIGIPYLEFRPSHYSITSL